MKPLTLKEHTCELIRGKLLSGALRAGSRLSDDVLAKEVGISRSPVREAISQLASEGLVELRPRSGAYVKAPDPRELDELYELREALERLAARKATTRIDAAGLAELRELCQEMHAIVEACRSLSTHVADDELVRRFLASDLAFHSVILRAAGNSRLTKLVADFKIVSRVLEFVRPIDRDFRVLSITCSEHQRIFQAIQDRDAKAAGNWMAKHIRSAKRIMFKGYQMGMAAEKSRPARD